MDNLYENLLWLQKTTKEFSQQLSNASDVADFRQLAKYSLDETQLNRLYNKFKKFRDRIDVLERQVDTLYMSECGGESF